MKSVGINFVEGMWGNILIIVGASAYCMIDMILRGVTDLEQKANRIFYGILGVLGLVLLIWGIAELVINDYSLISGRSLSEHGARLLINSAWVLVGAAYVYKVRCLGNGEEG